MKPKPDSPLASDQERLELTEVRQGLIRLHKALLDAERIRFERDHGRIERETELLHLVLHDPWFAWLRPLSALIVQLDERLDSDDPITAREAELLRDEARSLIVPSVTGEGFRRNYHRSLQESPEVVLAHGNLARSFKPKH